MDALIPADIVGAMDVARRNSERTRARYRVIAGEREHPVMELTDTGFVIEADGRPPLRGYADVFLGERRVLRSLVVCDWARDGLVGYDFKHDNSGCEVPADYARSDIAGLLSPPA